MKPKTILRWLLLLYVVACFGTIVAKEFRGRGDAAFARSAEPAASATPVEPVADNDDEARAKVVVTYFHGKFRCPTCRAIEAYAKDAVEKDLADLVSEGAVEWRVVDFDQPGNEHFLRDYQLSTQSLILSLEKGGKELRWKNLERVWELAHSPAEFADYVLTETRDFSADE